MGAEEKENVLRRQVAVVKSAWPTLLLIAGALAVAIWTLSSHLYSARIDNLKSEIALLERKLASNSANQAPSQDDEYTKEARRIRRGGPMYSLNLFLDLATKGVTSVRGDPRNPKTVVEGATDQFAPWVFDENLKIGAARILLRDGYIRSVEKLGEGQYSLIASDKVSPVYRAMEKLRVSEQ